MTVLIEVLAELASLEDAIRANRPEAIRLKHTEVRLDYRVDAETGAEYAAFDVALPGSWLGEIEGDTDGRLTGVGLYLDDE